MADITTPTTARKPEEFSSTQIKLVRDSLGISDDVYQPDRTYIIFNADAGDNNLHIITSGSLTYSIMQGDGTQPVSYIDTGGTKVLNYITAGRYVITIDGTFNGISTSGEIAADKDKYIEIIAGSNYPTTIPANAFDTCENLRNVIFTSVATIATEAFKDNTELRLAQFNSATSVQSDSFDGCDNLILLELPLDPTNSLVNVDNLNVSGNIIPDTNETSDLGSSSKAFNNLYIKNIECTDNTWSALPIDLTTSLYCSAADVEYRIGYDDTVEFRGTLTFASGAIGASFTIDGTAVDMFGGKDLKKEYTLFEFGLDGSTIRSYGWGKIQYVDSGEYLGFLFDFTDLVSVSDSVSFYMKAPLD